MQSILSKIEQILTPYLDKKNNQPDIKVWDDDIVMLDNKLMFISALSALICYMGELYTKIAKISIMYSKFRW